MGEAGRPALECALPWLLSSPVTSGSATRPACVELAPGAPWAAGRELAGSRWEKPFLPSRGARFTACDKPVSRSALGENSRGGGQAVTFLSFSTGTDHGAHQRQMLPEMFPIDVLSVANQWKNTFFDFKNSN